MVQEFEIRGRLDGANEFIRAHNKGRKAGARCMRENKEVVIWAIKTAHLKPMAGKVNIHYTWIEPNMRRDHSNIRFGDKFIEDALVDAGIIKDDGWSFVGEITDTYRVSRKNPRIIVRLEEA